MWRGVDKTTNDVRFITRAVIHKDFDEDTVKTGLPTGQGSISDCFYSILQILMLQEDRSVSSFIQYSILNIENNLEIYILNEDEETRKFLVYFQWYTLFTEVLNVLPKSNTKFPPLSLFQI